MVGSRGGTLARAGGVSLTHSGAGGALLARLYVEDAKKGYSSWARFTDPAKGRSTTYQGAGLRLGSVAGERLTPVVVARNVGETETTISGRIPYTLKDGSTGVVQIPPLRLAPGEADTVDLTATSYACQNCCPDNLYDLTVVPGDTNGFPNDTTRFQLLGRTFDCYGSISELSVVFTDFWSSTDVSVADYGTIGEDYLYTGNRTRRGGGA